MWHLDLCPRLVVSRILAGAEARLGHGMRAHRRCRRHHGGEAWGGLDVDITRTVSLTRVSRVPQSTAEKRGSSVTRSHHASREFCHAMRLTSHAIF